MRRRRKRPGRKQCGCQDHRQNNIDFLFRLFVCHSPVGALFLSLTAVLPALNALSGFSYFIVLSDLTSITDLSGFTVLSDLTSITDLSGFTVLSDLASITGLSGFTVLSDLASITGLSGSSDLFDLSVCPDHSPDIKYKEENNRQHRKDSCHAVTDGGCCFQKLRIFK